MKVRELIEILSTYDPELDVIGQHGETFVPLHEVDSGEWDDDWNYNYLSETKNAVCVWAHP